MKRLVILVALAQRRAKDPTEPLGHASILASLRAEPMVETQSIVVDADDCNVEKLADEILQGARGYKLHQVDLAIGVYIWAEKATQRLLSILRARGFAGRIILGGPQISYTDQGLASYYPQANVFIRGFAEKAMSFLAKTPGSPRYGGICYAESQDVCATTSFSNLTQLPSPWQADTFTQQPQKFIRWETQRGCPYRCSFCQHRAPDANAKPAFFSLKRIFAEINLFCQNDVHDIAVVDPVFNQSPHAIEILNKFVKCGYRGRLSLQCRAETIKPDFIKALQGLDVRLEFGLQTIHHLEGKEIRRTNNLNKVEEILALLNQSRIPFELSLIYGLPLQSLKSFKESVQWCLERRVPVIKAFPLMLLRGTELYDQSQKWNFRENSDNIPLVVASDTFDETDWIAMGQMAKALRETEGKHPATIKELESIMDSKNGNAAKCFSPVRARFA